MLTSLKEREPVTRDLSSHTSCGPGWSHRHCPRSCVSPWSRAARCPDDVPEFSAGESNSPWHGQVREALWCGGLGKGGELPGCGLDSLADSAGSG